MANSSLRNFASGMIISTSVLTAVYYLQPTNNEEQKIVEEHIITDEEVQQYLEDKGYISISKQTYDELTAKAASQANNTNENKEAQIPQASPNQKQQEPEAETETPEKAVPEKIEAKQKAYTLIVHSGMDSIQIANTLEKSGIVKSGKDFEQFLTKKDWTRSIQVGTYELNSSMSYEQIGKIITKK